jgi:hypothetical protein
MRLPLALAAALLLAAPPADAHPRDWPRLQGGADVPECQRAFAIARDMFSYNENYLYAPFTPPAGSGDTLVLRREQLDVSSGNALIHDDGVFERVNHRFGRSFWQRTPQDGKRLVVDVQPYGWRGDQYIVYSLPVSTPRTVFDVDNFHRPDITFLVEDSWQPPAVLRNAEEALWLISFDSYALAPWRIDLAGSNATEPACTIQFRPEGRNAFDLLPADVLLFAVQIDETLGDGRNEGTLNQTGRDRSRMQHIWANAIYRPWAVAETSYGSRAEVDAGMRRWARQAPSFRAHYDAMTAQYPRAEAALALHYEREFGLTTEQAQTTAAYVINAAYTASYTFHRDDFRPPARTPNPWPQDR